MHLAIVTRRVGHNDGQGRVNLEIATEALAQGHHVRLVCEDVDPVVPATRDLLAPPKLLPSRLLRDQLFAWRSSLALRGRRDGSSAVLCNGFSTWAGCDVNAVHFVHRAWLRSPYHPARLEPGRRSWYPRLYSALNAQLERGAFRRSGMVVAVSEKVRQELIESGVPATRVTTILNGVDIAEFRPPADEGEQVAMRARFNLPPGVRLALFAGDLKTPRKNLETVLRALALADGVHLAVAGRHEQTGWPAMAAALGVADRVHFLGFQTAMPALMRAADLFVFPSRYEACSLVLLEALASGLPVITAHSAGGAEVVTGEVGIVLADCDDAACLAAALRALADDDPRRRHMATAARLVSLAHGWPQMARRYLILLQEAAERRAHPAGLAASATRATADQSRLSHA